ncbi:MAG: hypothetical protein QNJ55_10665 [Xenococcus sp. MO_188.B8]|nr:hypothetical protein [Xenococcus sp. MO_188.B8]
MALAVQYPVDSWLAEHIFILRLLQHPFISIVGFVITLVLFARLLVAIATVIDRLWLWILRLPITLFEAIFSAGEKPKDNLPATINYELTTNPEKFEQILQKLNAIEQQQQQILQDLAAIKNHAQSNQSKKQKLIKQIKGKM